MVPLVESPRDGGSRARAARYVVFACAISAFSGCSGAEQVAQGGDVAEPQRVATSSRSEVASSKSSTAQGAREARGPSREVSAAEARRAREAAEEADRRRLEAQRVAFEAAYPLHGVSYHFLARVYERPTYDSRPIGYMRRGTRFRASARTPGRSCAQGWHEVPGGGFVCRGDGYKVGAEPQSFEPSPQAPSLEDALPYAYASTPRAAVPQFWRLPSEAEERAVEGILRTVVAAESTPAAAPEADVEAPPPPGQASEGAGEPREPREATAEGETRPAEASAKAESGEARSPASDPLALPDFVRMRMRRGFYVSVDRRESSGGRDFVRTVRGAYVRSNTLTANDPPSHRGVVLGGSYRLPMAFVHLGGAHRLRRDPATGQLRPNGRFPRYDALVVNESIERSGTSYFITRTGDVVRETGVRLAQRIERPARVGEADRWIHVNLEQQTLVAYEGDRPVFATLVSTGRSGHETPKGLFRIESKHVSTTMDNLHDPATAYSIEDVPWTMYFEGNFALHGAFWHDGFGRVRSHGCVNLAPADARWIFQWTDPVLPASWHGVFARSGHPGTFIFID